MIAPLAHYVERGLDFEILLKQVRQINRSRNEE